MLRGLTWSLRASRIGGSGLGAITGTQHVLVRSFAAARIRLGFDHARLLHELSPVNVEAAGNASLATSRDDFGFKPGPLRIVVKAPKPALIELLNLLTTVGSLPLPKLAGSVSCLVGCCIRAIVSMLAGVEETVEKPNHTVSMALLNRVFEQPLPLHPAQFVGLGQPPFPTRT
jgi:hypothetical protein